MDSWLFRRNFPDLAELGPDLVEGLADQLTTAAERGIRDDHQVARVGVLQEVQVDLRRVEMGQINFIFHSIV